MVNFVIAQIFGTIALIVLIISFQKNEKKKLLKYQMFSSLLYAIQYAFLGPEAYTGCLMNLTSMIRNFIFKRYENKRPPLYLLIIIVALMITLSLISFEGLISLLPMLAMVLYSIAVWNGNLKIVRIADIISCLLYIIYNIVVQAYAGLVATIIEMLGAMVSLYKFNIKKVE